MRRAACQGGGVKAEEINSSSAVNSSSARRSARRFLMLAFEVFPSRDSRIVAKSPSSILLSETSASIPSTEGKATEGKATEGEAAEGGAAEGRAFLLGVGPPDELRLDLGPLASSLEGALEGALDAARLRC